MTGGRGLGHVVSVPVRRSLRNLAAAMALLLVGCRGQEATPPPTVEACASWQDERRALLDALALPPPSAAPPVAAPLSTEVVDGWSITPLTWTHPDSDGDHAFGAVYLPDPLPAGPRPLLINVHGHWAAGIEADEVNRRAILFAQQGWVVLSVANRGDEHGNDTPGWRRVHHLPAGYARARIRKAAAPLAWDIAAARAGIDLALTGRLGASVDRDRIATIGFSGGAERAAVLAAVDPRVAAVVMGAYEYAFSSGHGAAACTCGAVRGANAPLTDHAHSTGEMPATASGYLQPVQAWRWLALAGCRPGSPVAPRPVLLWDNFPDDVVDAELAALPTVTRRDVEGVHGISPEMAAASWAWLEGVTGGGEADEAQALTRANAGYSVIHPRWRPPFPDTLPSPGQREQGPPPWRADLEVRPEVQRRLLGLDHDDLPERLKIRAEPAVTVLPARAAEAKRAQGSDLAGMTARGRSAWLVVTSGAPGVLPKDQTELMAIPWRSGGEQLDGHGGIDTLRDLAPQAVFGHVELRVGRTAEEDIAATAWGAELGLPPLGVAVIDVLEAHARLRAHPEVDPARVGIVGIGGGGVAALQAALQIGETGPLALVDAPVTLWFDGPDAGAPFYPWPAWTVAPIPSGAALDPWPAGEALGGRIRWLAPRGGDRSPWTEHLPHGKVVPDWAAALRES